MEKAELEKLNPNIEYHPPNFDWEKARAKGLVLAQALKEYFPDLSVDNHVQDATYHLAIQLGRASIRLSNFSNLLAVIGEENLSDEEVRLIQNISEGFGYKFIPWKVLGEPFSKRGRFNGDVVHQLFDYK